ncbi:hypothetical protein CP02DC21_1606, partial [Chlamydia psittaci 02DC21]
GPDRLKSDQTGPDRPRPLKLGHKPVLTGSNQTRPSQTGFDRLEPVLTSSNQTRPAQTRPEWLKPVLTASNRF